MIEVIPLAEALTDGVVVLRASTSEDFALISASHDEAGRRYLGDPHPDPWACIVVGGEVVGWIDYDYGREWLEPTEVNLGFMVFSDFRRRGYALRAVRLLVEKHLVETQCTRATMLIEPDNRPSLAVAEKSMFTEVGSIDGQRFFVCPTVE